MKSTIKSTFAPIALLLIILFATGLAQAGVKTATLKITKAGAGNATITSSPVGINCGNTCRADFKTKTNVILTATVSTGSIFKGWKGDCKGTAVTCTVTMKEAQDVTAKTALLPITLNVVKTGSGTGTVTSLPAGIDCGATCSATYSAKSATFYANADKDRKKEHEDDDEENDDLHKRTALVTLIATPATGSTFSGWSGACTGTAATCTVTMNQTQNVTADFAPLQMTLNVTKTGIGTGGVITSLQTGIDCGGVCSGIYDWNTQVTLTATPATGSSFKGWSGACTGTTSICTVTMDQTQNITADFAPLQMPLSIAKTGSGTGGTITSTPAGIDCGITCNSNYAWSTSVTLTAIPATGSTFQGWTGACTGSAATCTVTMDQAQNITADFAPLQMALTITKTGTGTGGVITSLPSGIDCGITCNNNYDWNTPVTLTATPATGSTFQGWTGACTGSTATCTVTLDQAQNVTADFAPLQMALTIIKTGSGTGGAITSLPAGIDCGISCSGSYAWSTIVTLTATPTTGSTFQGWTGACTGSTATCTVTLDQAQNVSADFTPMQMALSIAKTGTGTGGTITSLPAGIDCGITCNSSYAWSTPVTLTATPATGSTFQGWTGACTGSATTCTVTLDQAQNVSADFAPAFKTLSLAKTGSGTGTLTSSPLGIDCGTICSATFTPGSVVTLTATPASGSTFGGWFGACTGTATTCTVTLSQAQAVNARFSAPAITTYQYDANGNLTQITDPLGRIRQIQFDTLNQPVRQLEPHPSIIGSTLGQIDTTYDSLGQVTRVIDPRNLSTDYGMDSLGNLLKQTSPDTGSTDVNYDAAGNLATRTDARGKTASYNYDSLNRISQIVYDDQTVNYSWDNCINGISRLCSLSNNNSNLSYSYDSHGRITGKTQSAGASPLTVSHTYNAAGQRIGSLSPGAQSIEYQWTGQHITAITSNGQPVISQITYEPDGQINGWTWGNNQQNERFYDLAGRIAIVSMGVDAQTQLQDSRYYGYDAAGRLIDEIDDTDPPLNQRHEYDELDRLIGSQRGESALSRIDYSYDLSGNRTGKIKDNATLYSYSADPNSNRLQGQSGAQTVSYSYDPAGNLTGDGTFSYSYNAAGRRITSTNIATGQTVSYGYDAIGQRITKTNGGNTTQYFYDEQGHLIGEYDATGQPIQEIIWLGDLPVAVLKPSVNSSATPDIYYIHADHLGTPRKITWPNDSKVVWTWESEAFGNSLPNQNPSGLGNFVFNLRFPGQYYDQETGLHYNMARYYNPKIGRYEQSDPIGLRGGINTYAYAGNSPLRYIDPTGLLVDAVFNLSTGSLVIVDRDNPFASASVNAFSGVDINGRVRSEPIPVAQYDILDYQSSNHQNWFRLDRQDSSPRNDIDDIRSGRGSPGSYRLHPGSVSLGCVTVGSSDTYSQISKLIQSTKTVDVLDLAPQFSTNQLPGRSDDPYPYRFGPARNESIRMFGTFTVIDGK